MKNLKKVTAGFLSLSLLTCVGATQAFADSPITASGGIDTKEATVGTVKTAEKIYNVEIAWGDFKYNYTEKWDTTQLKNIPEWKANTKSPDLGVNASDKISITNNSNVAIKATFAFVPTSGESEKDYSGVSGKFYSDSEYETSLIAGNADALELEKASNGSPQKDIVYMKLTGKPTNVTPTPGDTIGTVTVTISEPQNQG